MFEQVIQFVTRLEPVSFLIGAATSALLQLWIEFYIRQPSLRVSGSGSRMSNGLMANSISIENRPGWLGIHIPETRIFGFKLHPTIRWGVSFEGNPARDCRVRIYLKDTNEVIGQLWWQMPGGQLSDVTNIESGKAVSLKLFARQDADFKEYFTVRPEDREAGTILIPTQNQRFTGTKEFRVRINYFHSKNFDYDIKIIEKFDRTLEIRHLTGGGTF